MTSSSPMQVQLEEGGAFSMRSLLPDDPDLDDRSRIFLDTLSRKAGLEGDLWATAVKSADLVPFLDSIMVLDVIYGPRSDYVDAVIRHMGNDLVTYFGDRLGQKMSAQADTSYVRIGQVVHHANHTKAPVVGHTHKYVDGKGDIRMVGLYVPVTNGDKRAEQLLIHISLTEDTAPMAFDGARSC